MGMSWGTSNPFPLSRESRLSRSGFLSERFWGWGRSSEEGRWAEEEEADEWAEPVDSHSKDSVPLSPRLWLMYKRFFGTILIPQPTELAPSLLSASEGKSLTFKSLGESDSALFPSLRLLTGLCSFSTTISWWRGELGTPSSLLSSARLRARGMASLPESLRGRPRFLLGPRKPWGEGAVCSLLRACWGDIREDG